MANNLLAAYVKLKAEQRYSVRLELFLPPSERREKHGICRRGIDCV